MTSPCVYIHRDAQKNVLYVGVTNNIGNRIDAHNYASEWFKKIANVEVCHFDTREEAKAAEQILISTLHPEFNRMLPKKRTFNFYFMRKELVGDFMKAVSK